MPDPAFLAAYAVLADNIGPDASLGWDQLGFRGFLGFYGNGDGTAMTAFAAYVGEEGMAELRR